MAKVSEMVAFTLMPISCAAPLSSDTACMACPTFVLLTNNVSATMMTADVTMVTSVSPVTTSCPPKRRSGSMDTTDVKDFGAEPQMSSARFCSR